MVGIGDLRIGDDGVVVGDRRVPVGAIVTVDGTDGTLLLGAHPGVDPLAPELAILRSWAAELDFAALPED